jgi:hypothetical protein
VASRAPAEAAPAPRQAEPSRPAHHRVQTALQLTQPGDAAEREAVTTARRVVSLRPAPVAMQQRGVARAPAIPVPRPSAPASATTTPTAARNTVPPAIESAIGAARGGGAPLGEDVRRFLEPRFRADFSRVRIHTDARAANLSTRLGARAFTYGRDIFFNAGQFRPETPEGMELIAHELTHTIQQREAVQRDPDVTVRETTGPQAQRSLIGDALDWIADRVNVIPGFRLLTLVLGTNPVNGRAVERSAANVLRAVVEFLPGGTLIVEALDRYGVFDRVGGWIEGQLRSLGMVGSAFRAALMSFLDSLGITDIVRPGSVWDRARRIFSEPVDRLLGFARGLVAQVLTFIREAILRPLGALVANTRGYDLLRAVLGQDPVTGEAVPRTAETLLGGFMKLIGQDEVWENIKRSGAIPRAWAWFQGALGGLMGLVTSIPGRFMALLGSLEITDLVIVTRALGKVASTFASFVGDFLSWGLGTVVNLLQIIVEVVAPGVMPYIRRAAGAFETIVRNPVAFVRTLVGAASLGFRQFASRFIGHLRASLIGWLTGAMGGAGIYIPQGFNLREILKFALSVMGLTWANIRGKLVRATNETVVRALETGFDVIRTLITEGPAAAWEQIVQSLTNLREMVVEQVMEFVRSRIIQAAVTRLLSLLSPAGAFIQAIIATYNTVMFFVERLRQIAQVAASFIDSLATIAAGTIAPAANRVETTLAGLLTLAISFLARIAGLGRVSDAVIGVINRIRAPIDRALDRVVAWIVAQARRLGRFIAQAGVPHDPNERLRLAAGAAIAAARRLTGRVTAPLLRGVLAAIRTRYGLTSIEPYEQRGQWWVRAVINPIVNTNTGVASGTPAGTPAAPINLNSQGPLASLSDRAAAIAAMQAIGNKTQPGIDAISTLADAKFTQYKTEYVGTYAPAKAVGANFQWPHFYLRTRAARRAGFDAETRWRPIVFGGATPATFDIVRLDGSTTQVIPDVFSAAIVGDIKNWETLSLTQQLSDFSLIANPARAQSVRRNNRPYSALRQFHVAVRHDTHASGRTHVSGPLRAAVGATGGSVHYVITDHAETVEEFMTNRSWPRG